MPMEDIIVPAGGSLKKGDVLVSADFYMYKIISFDVTDNVELSYLGNLNGGSGSGGTGTAGKDGTGIVSISIMEV